MDPVGSGQREQAPSKHQNGVFLESLCNTLAPQSPCLRVPDGPYHEVAFAWPGRETELCSQANLAGNVIPFDPTGWQGLGNVSLHLFPPFPRGFPLPAGRLCNMPTGNGRTAAASLLPSRGWSCPSVLEGAAEPGSLGTPDPCLQRALAEQGCPTATFSTPPDASAPPDRLVQHRERGQRELSHHQRAGVTERSENALPKAQS